MPPSLPPGPPSWDGLSLMASEWEELEGATWQGADAAAADACAYVASELLGVDVVFLFFHGRIAPRHGQCFAHQCLHFVVTM
mgnify:CR=1 FL=1